MTNKPAKPSLVLDARKVQDSGIGTYIRNLIPYLQQAFALRLIGDRQKLEAYDCPVWHTKDGTYSLTDLYKPALWAGRCDVFWTPHFNFPLIRPKAKLCAMTLHDLYHRAHWPLLSLPQMTYYTLFMQNALRQTDLIFTISDFTKSEIQKYYSSTQALTKTQVIRLGVDTQHFKPTDAVQRLEAVRQKYALPEQYLLFVGNLKPNKNIMALLRAYQALCAENPETAAKVVIVGKKEGFRISDNEALAYIHQNGLADRVIFTGFVPDADLPMVFQLATLFVFPSLYEGFGLPPLEALACGCPVACASAASLPEVCGDSVFYFDGQNPDSLRELLQQLLADPCLRTSKLALAKEWLKRYDWGQTAEEHIRAINDRLKALK